MGRASKGKASYRALTYLLAFGLAIAVPLLLVLGALLYRSALVEREQLEQRVYRVLGSLVDDLEHDFDQHLIILNTLATSHSLPAERWEDFYHQAKAALQGRLGLVLTDATGRQLVNTFLPYGQAPALTGDPETIRRIAQTKRPVISNLFFGRASKTWVFNVSIPIVRNDEVRHVMSLALSVDDLQKRLERQSLDPEWVIMIWDANGAILARSRDGARHVGTIVPGRLRDQGQRAIVRTANLGGIDAWHATARSESSGWGVSVNVPYRTIGERMRGSLVLWGAAAIVAITVALALGLFFARQITTSLSVASDAAIAFGHGQRVEVARSGLKEADEFLNTLDRAQRELEDRSSALQRAEEQFRLAVQAAPTGMILVTPEGKIVSVNEHAEKLFGYDGNELIGQNVEMLVPDRFRNMHPAHRIIYAANPVTRSMGSGRDVFARRKDGFEMPVEIGLSSIATSQGALVLAAIVDITDRKKAEESQRLVIRELQHRTQNLLTVVQTVANRSIDEAKTFAEAKYVLSGRLKALATAYAELADAQWEGAQLQAIIERQVGALSQRIHVSGCDVFVTPSAAQQFALIIHELATNALKYGSLSTTAGKVFIEGKTERVDGGGTFSFGWREAGGPVVSAPSRKGFGSVILFDAASHFAENVGANFVPMGLEYHLRFSLGAIEAKPISDPGRKRHSSGGRPLVAAEERT